MVELSPEFLQFVYESYGMDWDALTKEQQSAAVHAYPDLIYKASA